MLAAQLAQASQGVGKQKDLNFPANLGEIVEFPVGEVEEHAVLIIVVEVGLALGLDELEDKGAARADVVAAGEEVAANEGFEDAGLATASAADDGDLGEVDGGLAFDAGEEVLKAVDHAGEDVLNLARVLI
ncbi:hypothetical protein GYH30_022626 [Glycine max]|uniref:Uncharacterized protein n=1 Tax=Glycine max TaxID=3847 RepID=K7L9C7_SOYBN|nr:hypothetical protein GYH30_022626 [Glycine max]